jgi:hypothetical protein
MPLSFDHDFDESSTAWMANKLRKGASMAYRCEVITSKGIQCTRAVSNHNPYSHHYVCKNHARYGTEHKEFVSQPSNDAPPSLQTSS